MSEDVQATTEVAEANLKVNQIVQFFCPFVQTLGRDSFHLYHAMTLKQISECCCWWWSSIAALRNSYETSR